MADNDNQNKPNVLVLGGLGFIGRNLVAYLVENELAGKIRAVDKVMPPMAWLSPRHKEVFTQVEFKHANLINPASVKRAFQLSDGLEFDYVFNCAAETKRGQCEAVYRDGIYKLSTLCIAEAERLCIRRYVEVSSAFMKASDTPLGEDCQCDPWTTQAKYKLAVERDLMECQDSLDYVVVRPAFVYGPGDRASITPRLVIAGVYKFLGEKLKVLWTKSLKANTVHVLDVVRAMWFLCTHGKRGQVYNLADKGDTSQGKLYDAISEMFGISVDYLGSILSTMASVSLSEVVDDINEKHMAPWGEACMRSGIRTTPLSPFIEEEMLLDRAVCVDGSKIEALGWQYQYPKLNTHLLTQVVEEYIQMGIFPPTLLKSSTH